MNLINKILEEWSYRVHDGMPNPKNPLHLVHLRESLQHLKIDGEVIDLMMNKLYEDTDDKYVSIGYGRYKEKGKEKDPDAPTFTKDDRGNYIPTKKDTDKEKEKSKEPEEKPPSKPKITKIEKNPMSGGDDDNQFDKKEKGDTKEKVRQNATSIFDDKVTGKGGGTTSLQEEIAGISRRIALEQPNLTEEEHKEVIAQFIKDNYGDTKYGSKDQTALIKKSASGPSTIKKIKANKNMKFSDNQPEGFPVQITFTDSGTAAVRNELEQKLEEAKQSGDAEAISHYETELKYFKKHATKETGIEGDGDTAMMYVDTDGRTRMIYVSNKQGLKDPHANATVKSASKAIKDSIEPGANEEALTSELDKAVKGGIDANGDMVKTFRADIDSSIEELNKSPLTKIATLFTTGRAEYVDKPSRKYIDECKKNEQVLEYLNKQDPKLDVDNDEHIVQAALAVAGSGDADGLNDSTKQAPNKLLFKMATAAASIRKKMRACMGGDESKLGECAKKVATKPGANKKPLMGGNVTTEDCLSIYNNKALEKLEQNVQTRKDAMQKAHEEMYNTVVELDVAHYQEQGISSDEALEKYKNEAGPNEQTYTKSFMKRMHWDRYIDGVDDDKKMIEIGDKAYSPKDFRNCLGELTGWGGKGSLKEHMEKNMRVKPGSMKLMFVTKEGKEVEIGNDTWRTAGDLSKIAGGLGTDMQKCLGSK